MNANAEWFRGNNPDDNKKKPPRARFSQKAVFSKALSDKRGMSSYVDQDVVTVTSPSGDVEFTKPVDVWFSEIERDPNYFNWVPSYKSMYESWKKANNTASVQGTHVKLWPMASPAQIETLTQAGVLTVEDVSKMPDELAAAIDGGPFLRSKARYWINSAEDIGQVAARAANLEADNDTLRAQVEDLSKKFDEAKAEVERLNAHFTGKEGYDVIAGRVQPVGLQVVQNVQPQAAPEPEPIPSAPAPEAPSLKSLAELEAMSMGDLRNYAYENDVKPSNAKDETLKRIQEAGKSLQ